MENLKRLSEFANASKKPANYVRAFREGLSERKFRAFILADRFKLTGTQKGKVREIEDYAIIDTPEFRTWHTEMAARVSGAVRGAPSFADLKSGKVSLEDAERVTRELLEKKARRNQAQNERAKAKRKGRTAVAASQETAVRPAPKIAEAEAKFFSEQILDLSGTGL